MKDVEEYYELSEVYGDRPVLCITPIWREIGIHLKENKCLSSVKIRDICAKYSNITVVEGFKLVPHMSEYFLDTIQMPLVQKYTVETLC